MNMKVLVGGIIIIILVVGAYLVATQNNPAPADTQPEVVSTTTEISWTPEASRAVGTWQSTEDPKFTREFRIDGTVTDMYEGDAAATANGTWSQVIDISAEQFEFPAVDNATFLKLVFSDGEPMYFAIAADTTDDRLVLVNLSGRGNVLTFARMQ
ncbi:hypothetical protein A2763_03275 [Candidatus Kaiserbacteria bacterium RIFCSPHIGHO2_01_FULL_54_36]|uniref:DUF5640 domain-containing protein n=1 Tax=Candidatus Kaiserbacteria bacterium RIFCSPHIGHO2_01_FULL_54_36 TaxID=1798482 RepID=A0A1F6CKA1_9BACT|nr:MAG: hypothetical protein A2763_03275 [Candidatus Kaiserbacteria bacterium RIFCSPHIGHO2_01_FULL_54_36]OGG75420.1 MAG: hypothetical protein A3A41_02530 [Candidatus Kaiserbacteria bacterium RIFCSPLOWO2_01_FULL_54_22]